MSKEEQDYMKRVEAAFSKQKTVQLRKLTMTKERYQQLAYTYCQITDDEELADFAFISTHEGARQYYLSNTNYAIMEQLAKIANKKYPLEKCISNGALRVNNDIPLSIRVSNAFDFRNPPQTLSEIILDCVNYLPKGVLIMLSIILIIRLLSLPLDELASAYLASHPL